MEGHLTAVDDQSHYEISLTAGQAFVAFVLLLLSLAAAFAFGLVIGKGQADDRLVVRKETPVVTEAGLIPKKDSGRIVELGVAADDFEDAEEPEPPKAETSSVVSVIVPEPVTDAPATPVDDAATEPVTEARSATPATQPVAETRAAAAAPAKTPAARVPHIAQLASSGDQKAAEALAVKLIESGFSSAYVERGATEKGPVFRVRVRFESEAAARAAEARLREFSPEVWITVAR